MSVQHSLRGHRRALAVATGVAAVLSIAGPASAKGGGDINNTVVQIAPGVTTSTPCQIKSFKTSSVTGVGETGLSSISADYQVRPCDSKHTVTVDVLVYQTFDATNVLREEANAPLDDKFTIFGVQLGVSYTIKLTVHDGDTGAVVATASRTASAAFPTGV
jgi:hypothetical protein